MTIAAAGKKLVPQTTIGILRSIVLFALIPFLLLQTVIYLFWYKTRMQTETDSNIEVALSVAAAFSSYVQDIQRQELVTGDAIQIGAALSLEHAGKLLSFVKTQYPTVLRFSLVDQRGIILASSDQRVVGASVADRTYFQHLSKGPGWIVGDLSGAPETNKEVFSIASRLEESNGGWQILVALVDPDQLGKLELSLDRTAEGVFTLFDDKGTLVFYSGISEPKHTNWKTVDPVLYRAFRERRQTVGTITYPLDGKDHFVARVPIPGLRWIAGASRPVGTAMAPIYRTLVWIGTLNIAMLFVSFAGAVGLSRFLIGRLSQLRENARRIAHGEYSSKANIRNPVELAELEASFNSMALQIQARQQSLQKAVADLTRSNQELEQFAYVASHDLQEPLRVITGFVQLLEKRYKGQLDPDADRYIGFITDAVMRQQELIRDVLAFSRLGRRAVQLERIDSNVAVKAALQNIHPLIADSKADVIHDTLPAVKADGLQLVQLFQNLVSNAIKFRRSERPSIHISAQPENGAWIFSVRDNGIGIEPQYWEQIFTMFKRLHTRKDYPGTGIGLAICKKIVERHGGRIWVDSKPGEGSTFYFTLMAAGDSQ